MKRLSLNVFYSYRGDILAHVEQVSDKLLMHVKSNLITLVDKTISKRIRVQTQRYSDINFNPKKNKLEMEIIHVINCFSDDTTLSSKSNVDENTNVIKVLKSTLEIYYYSVIFIFMLENSK